jgi:hypothetical protein
VTGVTAPIDDPLYQATKVAASGRGSLKEDIMANGAPRTLRRVSSIVDTLVPNIPVAIAVIAMLLLAGWLGYHIVSGKPADANPTFGFISIVIIFMAALTVAATVFVGLGLADPLEAFGLPSGSMRALLAIGIMILFVVFGLPMITSPAGDPVKEARGKVAAERLDEAVRFHRDQGLKVRIVNYGSVAVAEVRAADGRVTLAASPAVPAEYETFGRVDPRSPESVDFGKQILTAVITLLTSVVSFYFGSRAVTDGAPANPGQGGRPGANPAADRLRVAGTWKDLAKRIADLGARADKVPDDTPERKSAHKALAPARKRIEERSESIEKHIAAADAAFALVATSTVAADIARHSKVAADHLAEAEVLIAAAEADRIGYAEAVEKLEKL